VAGCAAPRRGLPERGLPERGLTEATTLGLLAALLVALLVCFPRTEGPAFDANRALRDLMTEGPGAGAWRSTGLGEERSLWVQPHPEDPTCLLLASSGRGREGGKPRALPRRWAAAFLVGGRADLFFHNYVLDGPPAPDPGAAGGAQLHAVWRPVARRGGETARHVWLDARTGQVRRVEDRSWNDDAIRTLAWTGPESGPLAEVLAPGGTAPACRTDRRPRGAAPDLARVAAEAPFPLLAPTWLPRGYELLEARYRVWPLPRGETEPDDEATPRRQIRIAYLLYGDGLGSLSLGIALPQDMDALERAVETMRESRTSPDACPELPEGSRPVAADGMVIRRRRDRCRTVLRVDDLHGVSAALLGRNEVPEDEYVRVVQSLEVVEPGPGTRPGGVPGED
jgi:hypothetical protein